MLGCWKGWAQVTVGQGRARQGLTSAGSRHRMAMCSLGDVPSECMPFACATSKRPPPIHIYSKRIHTLIALGARSARMNQPRKWNTIASVLKFFGSQSMNQWKLFPLLVRSITVNDRRLQLPCSALLWKEANVAAWSSMQHVKQPKWNENLIK